MPRFIFLTRMNRPCLTILGRLAGELLQSEQRQLIKDISLLDGHAHEAYRIFVGGVERPEGILVHQGVER